MLQSGALISPVYQRPIRSAPAGAERVTPTTMHITHLSLTNFRNYGRLEWDVPSGVTVLQGDNAQGKTNLLEAIYYLATTRSPHTYQDDQLIHWEADSDTESVVVGRLVAHVRTQEGLRHLEVRLIREYRLGQTTLRREALVDRRKVRLMDLLGNLRVVMFLPEDVNLVTGPPINRRRYLDITLCQSDRAYCRALASYNKVLEQRNALLRRLAEQGMRPDDEEVLGIYTDKLVEGGSRVLARRATFLAELGRAVQRVHYEVLTGRQETLRLAYLPCLQIGAAEADDAAGLDEWQAAAEWLQAQHNRPKAVAEQFHQALHAVRGQELARGSTQIGPHRDDWRFWVNGRSLGDYGSRGQQRTAILALKMAETDWVSAETGDQPVLLLDDVLAELDSQRRRLLLEHVRHAPQALITTTDATIIGPAGLPQASWWEVQQGRLAPLSLPVPSDIDSLTPKGATTYTNE